MHTNFEAVPTWLDTVEEGDLPLAPTETTDVNDDGRSLEAIQLIDNSGVTWIRHFCRSCRKTTLWAVLGEPTPMCRECREHMHRPEPLGSQRFDRLPSDYSRQDAQYHGEHPYGEGLTPCD